MPTLLVTECQASGTVCCWQRVAQRPSSWNWRVTCTKAVDRANTCRSVVPKRTHATTGAGYCIRVAAGVPNTGTNKFDPEGSEDSSLQQTGCLQNAESMRQPDDPLSQDMTTVSHSITTNQTQHAQQQQQNITPAGKPRGVQAAKQFIMQHGPGAFLSYITTSNILSVVMLSTAWVLYTKTTGITPLGPGQWPRFLVFYAGAYAMQHLARPLKLAVGLAGAPVGSAAVDKLSSVLGSSKTAALVVLLICEAVTLLACVGCVVLYAKSLAAGLVR